MVLFINACARPRSRTFALAERAARQLSKNIEILNLYEEELNPLDNDILEKRDEYIKNADYSDDLFRFAKQFSKADELIIAAPYWDLSFPAILKCYIEAVCINGLTFRYNEQGIPEGLCRAKRLIYITTAGGFIPESNYGYDYVSRLCTDLFGIKNTVCIKAEGLDIEGADIAEIMKAAQARIELL